MLIRLLVLSIALACCTTATAGVAVVSSASDADELDAQSVRRIFLGRERSIGDAPVQVVFQKNGPLRDAFDTSVLGKSGAGRTAHWSRLIFTGQAKAPAEVANDAAVKERVLAHPGAIGYVSRDAVDDSLRVVHEF